MSNRIKNNLKNLVGQTLNQYYSKVKPTISDLRYKQEYQNRIIECMVGEVDDNYITTPETDNHIVKLEHSKEGVVKIPSIKGKTILIDADGNETDTPGEGCRLISVGESENNRLLISSKNKNIFDGEIERYFINSSTGQNNGWMEYWRSKDYIRCAPNEKHLVHFKYKDVKKNGVMFFYDKDKNYIGMTYTNPNVTPSNCEFIRIAGQAENSGTLIDITKVTDIMVCKGADVADYIEPKQHKTEILLNEPLRSLPNGVCDEIVGNKVIRRTDKIVIDGTKRFNYSILEDNNIVRFWSSRDNLGIPKIKSGSVVKCNILQNVPYGTLELRRDEGIGVKQSSGSIDIGINLSKERNVFNNIDFEKWLSENNVIMIYELAEPIIEELPNSITLQGFDDTTMYIENSITPTVQYGYNALIPYKEELSNQKEEVETNTLDIEQNIIPYLMDMEFNLMLMEDE